MLHGGKFEVTSIHANPTVSIKKIIIGKLIVIEMYSLNFPQKPQSIH
jgi:hypothetical protein